MPNRLYIVGNGFDLHHGIKSSYLAFGPKTDPWSSQTSSPR
ncbi:AbiH family protein [Mesorhizobium sp. M0563]